MDIARLVLLVFYICLNSHTTANTKNINGLDILDNALLAFVAAGEAGLVDEPVRFRGAYSEGTVTTILSRSVVIHTLGELSSREREKKRHTKE